MPLMFSGGPCPSCGSISAKRSQRKNFFERAVSFFLLPWRCDYCYFRFFRVRWVWAA